jgi:hypothetical protein
MGSDVRVGMAVEARNPLPPKATDPARTFSVKGVNVDSDPYPWYMEHDLALERTDMMCESPSCAIHEGYCVGEATFE